MHLFAGVGGGLLADLILGHEPIIAVERDAYCCKVLRERTADGWFPNLQVWEGDIRLFDPSEYKGRVDCVHAGFPCQPHSVAGKRKGEADERNLWPDTARIVGEIRPRFVFLENVPGIVSNGFAAVVVGELSAMGYDSQWGIISASNAGACHRRARWWCVSELSDATNGGRKQTQGEKESLSDANSDGLQRRAGGKFEKEGGKKQKGSEAAGGAGKMWGYWSVEPNVGRVANGVASRVDKLKALGNGQVPIQAALAWRLLMKKQP